MISVCSAVTTAAGIVDCSDGNPVYAIFRGPLFEYMRHRCPETVSPVTAHPAEFRRLLIAVDC